MDSQRKYSLNVSTDDMKEERRKIKENYSGLTISFIHSFSTFLKHPYVSKMVQVIEKTMYESTEVVPDQR